MTRISLTCTEISTSRSGTSAHAHVSPDFAFCTTETNRRNRAIGDRGVGSSSDVITRNRAVWRDSRCVSRLCLDTLFPSNAISLSATSVFSSAKALASRQPLTFVEARLVNSVDECRPSKHSACGIKEMQIARAVSAASPLDQIVTLSELPGRRHLFLLAADRTGFLEEA
jgi:hypothetical protein